MGLPVLIYGKSGAGKSRSLKNFAEDELLIFNIERKAFPFRKQFKYVAVTDNVDTIMTQLGKMPCKTAVIDDAGYIMTHHFMKNHRNKKGNASFDMYDDIADMMYTLVKRIKEELPDDVIVYIVMHEDIDDLGGTKLLTLGKLLDNKVNLVGMVTLAIRCMSENGKHFFRTVTDGNDITKAPEEMFPESETENDLKAVDGMIREYYGFNTKEDKTNE